MGGISQRSINQSMGSTWGARRSHSGTVSDRQSRRWVARNSSSMSSISTPSSLFSTLRSLWVSSQPAALSDWRRRRRLLPSPTTTSWQASAAGMSRQVPCGAWAAPHSWHAVEPGITASAGGGTEESSSSCGDPQDRHMGTVTQMQVAAVSSSAADEGTATVAGEWSAGAEASLSVHDSSAEFMSNWGQN